MRKKYGSNLFFIDYRHLRYENWFLMLFFVCMILWCRYVLRRILRRAARFATEKLNAKQGQFASLITVVQEILVRVQLFMFSPLKIGVKFLL